MEPAARPRPLGTTGSSFGFGDRLGLATPGHVRALLAAGAVAPALAQQSARELERHFVRHLEPLAGIR
jgi:tagaturonate epimerase